MYVYIYIYVHMQVLSRCTSKRQDRQTQNRTWLEQREAETSHEYTPELLRNAEYGNLRIPHSIQATLLRCHGRKSVAESQTQMLGCHNYVEGNLFRMTCGPRSSHFKIAWLTNSSTELLQNIVMELLQNNWMEFFQNRSILFKITSVN